MNEPLRTHGPPLAPLAEMTDLSMPAGPREQRLVVLVLVGALLLLVIVAPFEQIPLPEAQRFIRIYQPVLVLAHFATAALLLGQLALRRSGALRVLACAYVFVGGAALVHLLASPGLFGTAGADAQQALHTAAWMHMVWHLGFPIMGDAAYLADGEVGETQTLAVGDPPLCLHALRISFAHPLTKERVTFAAEQPEWAR